MKSIYLYLFSVSINVSRFCLLAVLVACTAQAEESHDHEHEQHDHESHADKTAHDDHQGHDHSSHKGHGDHSATESHDEHDHDEHVAQVTPEVLTEFGVTLGKAGVGSLKEEIVLPGEIQFNRENLAYATPRYDGVVMSINVRLADHVKKGDVLVTLESVETLRPFDVKSPIDGSIVVYGVTPGQTVEAGTPLFTVADLSTVWADLRIYQRDLSKIHRGQTVLIEGGHDSPTFRGEIAYISPTLDEHTRTGMARVIVDNANGQWRPGQFIKGQVSIVDYDVAVAVPRTAVITHENDQVVFVKTDEGYEPRPVKLGRRDAESIEVLIGLSAGETIATENVISLKAELGKASFGGHEGHAH